MKRLIYTRLMLLLAVTTLSGIAAANEPASQVTIQSPTATTGGVDFEITPSNTVIPERKILYSVTQNDYVWKNGPASFPRGTSYTVLEGDPYGAGPYTIRIKFPPHYKLPAYAHGDLEEITVISGVLHVALGDELKDGEGLDLPAGGFTVFAPNANHFVWTGPEGAIVQYHGTAPRTAMYVDKKNDPTWKKQLQPDSMFASKTDAKTLAASKAQDKALTAKIARRTHGKPLSTGVIASLKNTVSIASQRVADTLTIHAANRGTKNAMLKSTKNKSAKNKLAPSLRKVAVTTASHATLKLAKNSFIIAPKAKTIASSKRKNTAVEL
jgi:hypothetical protein